jgi:hypothetical protein
VIKQESFWENKLPFVATIFIALSYFLSVAFIRNSSRGLNIFLLFIILIVLGIAVVLFFWASLSLDFKMWIKRSAVVGVILYNIFLLGINLLFIDNFTASVAVPLVSIFLLFISAVLFLVFSIKMED